jgi:hypothetical protein
MFPISLRGMGHPACSRNFFDVGSLIYRRVRENNCRFLGSRWSLGMTTFLLLVARDDNLFIWVGGTCLSTSLRGMGHPACSRNCFDVGSLIYRRVRENNCRFLGSRWSLGMTTFLLLVARDNNLFIWVGGTCLSTSLRGMGHPACSRNCLDVGSLISWRVRENNCRFLGSRWSLGMTILLLLVARNDNFFIRVGGTCGWPGRRRWIVASPGRRFCRWR